MPKGVVDTEVTAAAVGAGLVERERELDLLAEAFARVRAHGRGECVLISGEAGIGKTALIEHSCRALAGSARIVVGACEPFFSPTPLAPIMDVARACGGPLLERLERGCTPYDAATGLLAELEGGAATVVVLEDVHLADDATLDVLRFLVRRCTAAPVLLLVSYRDVELPRAHPLRRVLGEVAAGGSLRRLRPAPLSTAGVREIVGDRLDASELHRKTGGNPFFVVEAAATGQELPLGVRDAVLARTAELSPVGWAAVEAVAVSPVPVELELLEAIALDAPAGVDEAVAAGLFVAGPDARLRFRHELVRQAIEESLTPHRRVLLHRAALRALEARGDAGRLAARLAHHAHAAADTEAVLRYAPLAGDRAAAVGAHREAAAQYARALAHAEAVPPARRAALYEQRWLECYLTTQDDEAEAAIEQARAIYAELGDPLREGDALRRLAVVHLNRGRSRDALATAAEAVALLEGLPNGPELAAAYAASAVVSLLSEDTPRTVGSARAAFELAEELGDLAGFAGALATAGVAQAIHGSSEGLELLERALALAREHGFEAQVGRISMLLGMAHSRTRSLDAMEALVEPALALCDARDLAVSGRYLLAMRSWIALQRSDWDCAAEVATLVVNYGCLLSALQARIVLGLVRARRGDPDCWLPLDEAERVARRTGDLWWLAQSAAARAEAAWLEGRNDAVADATEQAYRLALDVGSPWPLGELAVWRRRAGIVEPPPPAAVEPFAAQLAGDLRSAAEWWSRAGCSYDAALALADSGAPDELTEALERLQRLDAKPAAAAVARRLRERGVRGVPRGPRPSTLANPARLTRRELEVLTLLGDGLRNQEIASRLFLSPRTVEHHVAAVLRKLGAQTRAHAVSEGVRLGVLAAPGRHPA